MDKFQLVSDYRPSGDQPEAIAGLTNGVTYYGKVFSVNPKERINSRADLTVFAAVPAAHPKIPICLLTCRSGWRPGH